jgi:hypothetical protein
MLTTPFTELLGCRLPLQQAPMGGVLTSSRYNRPSMPERYQVADDLREPMAAVVAAAEQEAITAAARRR